MQQETIPRPKPHPGRYRSCLCPECRVWRKAALRRRWEAEKAGLPPPRYQRIKRTGLPTWVRINAPVGVVWFDPAGDPVAVQSTEVRVIFRFMVELKTGVHLNRQTLSVARPDGQAPELLLYRQDDPVFQGYRRIFAAREALEHLVARAQACLAADMPHHWNMGKEADGFTAHVERLMGRA